MSVAGALGLMVGSLGFLGFLHVYVSPQACAFHSRICWLGVQPFLERVRSQSSSLTYSLSPRGLLILCLYLKHLYHAFIIVISWDPCSPQIFFKKLNSGRTYLLSDLSLSVCAQDTFSISSLGQEGGLRIGGGLVHRCSGHPPLHIGCPEPSPGFTEERGLQSPLPLGDMPSGGWPASRGN